MSTFVFLGPSLPVDTAREELAAAVYLPPVRRGDVYRLVSERRPAVIGIVDGLFDRVPAVAHKEILFALSQGVHVLGAGSMGALRATELWQFGMEGVGRVFEMYRDGAWDADDEVAVLHGPQETGFRPMSVALASIRLALETAQERGDISADTAAALVALARSQFYADRSWTALYEQGAAAGLEAGELAALREFVERERPDAKRDDALQLLRRIRTLLEDGSASQSLEVDFDFESTTYWERLVTETHSVATAGIGERLPVTHSAVERHVGLQPDGPEYIRGAALLHLLLMEARRRGHPISQADVQESSERYRRRRGLLSGEQTRDWLQSQHMTAAELSTLMSLEVTLQHVLKEASASIRGLLKLELQRRGVFGDVADAVAQKQKTLDAMGVNGLTLDDVNVSFPALMEWYQQRYEPVEETLEVHAARRGFASARAFLCELLLDYRIASQGTPATAPTER